MLRSNTLKTFLLAFLTVGGTALAQVMPQQSSKDIDVSDEEVSQFVDAYQKVQMVNREGQQKMMTTIKKNDLTTQEFQSMRKAKMNPDKEMDASAEKKANFRKVNSKIEAMQPKMQSKMEEAIQSTGLSTDRYQAIASAARSDKELQKKIRSKMQSQSKAGSMGGGGRGM